MNNNRASRRFTIIIFILTACSIAFAFVHSTMPADVSQDESQGVMRVITNLFGFFGLSEELLEEILRKIAHFTEFSFIGAMLTSCAYAFDRIKPHRFYSQVLFAGLLTAVIDETIQLGSEGRASMVTDVLIDFAGVVFGGAVMFAVYAIYRRIRKIRETE